MDEERDDYRKRSYFQENYAENEESKKRSLTFQRKQQDLIAEYTFYRYLCPRRKAGLVIGRGGEIMKHLRADTGARILIEDAKQGCAERVVTISSSSKETNPFCYKKDYACPAQDALFKVHEKIAIEEPFVGDEGHHIDVKQVTARLLIPSDQARSIIGRRGDTIKNMRKDSGAWICIQTDNRVPICADSTEELLEITGDALVVREALFQISCLLHEYPSRFHDQISFKPHSPFGFHSIRDPTIRPCSSKKDSNEFTLCLLCPSVNIRDVIGKGGANINQIRQESGATINLDCFFDEEDCIILISAEELMGISNSPTIDAATQLQPSCSTKVECEGGKSSYTMRLLVHRSQVGGLIGKGGSVIKEIRRTTQTTISIVENSLLSVASVDDAMVQICGDLNNVRDALIQVINRLKIRHFSRVGLFSASSSAPRYMATNSTHESICTGDNVEPRSHEHYSQVDDNN